MYNANLAELREKLTALHEGDEKQLEVIFSESPRLIVEAPAGYGKTKTMISRIAYLFAAGKIPNPKRILGLTFSVNAALKVKREVAEKLPSLIGSQNSPVLLSEKATVTNYHGFCKGILKKYGYLITNSLRKDVNLFRAIGDTDIERIPNLKTVLTAQELDRLKAVESSVKEARIPDAQTISSYNDIVINKLMPMDYITHNAVILLVLEIFTRFSEVKKFYQSYYPLIVVDEFQDTNCIAWTLLSEVISDKTQLVFLGDPLQRIYGFIGALPDIMKTATEHYAMSTVALSRNYRFRNNPEMLKLDRNIRANAASNFSPTIQSDEVAKLPAFWGNTQQGEAEQVVAKIKEISSYSNDKVAILFRGRGKNAVIIENELSKEHIEYFYGMFTDDDPEYIEFHVRSQEIFVKRFGVSKIITKKTLKSFSDSMKREYNSSSGKTVDSLLRLLDALIEKISIDYSDLDSGDKYSLLLDVFENRQLKQAMEYVDSQVILSTVHGAKGLEWDYVFLTDVERWIFPGYYTCDKCSNKYSSPSNCRCSLPEPMPMDFKDVALDELSVFYVGVTRAKRQVFISASAKRQDSFGNEKGSMFSCMASIAGLQLVKG